MEDTACERFDDVPFDDFLELKTNSSSFLKSPWQKRRCVIWRNFFYIYESSTGSSFDFTKESQIFIDLTSFTQNKKTSICEAVIKWISSIWLFSPNLLSLSALAIRWMIQSCVSQKKINIVNSNMQGLSWQKESENCHSNLKCYITTRLLRLFWFQKVLKSHLAIY